MDYIAIAIMAVTSLANLFLGAWIYQRASRGLPLIQWKRYQARSYLEPPHSEDSHSNSSDSKAHGRYTATRYVRPE